MGQGSGAGSISTLTESQLDSGRLTKSGLRRVPTEEVAHKTYSQQTITRFDFPWWSLVYLGAALVLQTWTVVL